MSELNIVVCVKVTPKPEEVWVDPESMMLVREGAASEINPPDMNAMEMALDLRDRYGGRVNILSMGPPFILPYLRVALAMGADHIYLLSDRAFAGADTLATTLTLAKGIEKIGAVDLILCGEESSDGATGQVPSGVAEWLNIGQLTLASEIDVDFEELFVQGRRELGVGYQILECPFPCVISVKSAINEPRFMDYHIKSWAFEEAKATIWSCIDIHADPAEVGLRGSPTIVSGLIEANVRQRRQEFISGSPGTISNKLLDILRDEGLC